MSPSLKSMAFPRSPLISSVPDRCDFQILNSKNGKGDSLRLPLSQTPSIRYPMICILSSMRPM